MEELDLVNGFRPKEIHTIISWNGEKNYPKVNEYIKKFPVENIKVLFNEKISLSQDEGKKIAKKIYNSNSAPNRVINGCVQLLIIEDSKPMYSHEKATSCWQVLNKSMKIIKEDMRTKIGGSIKNYGSFHTSYNTEEALIVLEAFNLKKYINRPKFKDFNELFDFLNNSKNLKYVIQRSFHEIEYGISYFNNSNDIDILVNDYYYFKALTGARSNNRAKMRDNDNGYNVQSTINIGKKEIKFDIRFVGDNYVDSNWEKDMLNRRILHTLKQNITIATPNIQDELYSLVYHIIIQKKNPSKSKHIPRVQKLIQDINKNSIDFQDIKSVRTFLDSFMKENSYEYKKPKDIIVNFLI